MVLPSTDFRLAICAPFSNDLTTLQPQRPAPAEDGGAVHDFFAQFLRQPYRPHASSGRIGDRGVPSCGFIGSESHPGNKLPIVEQNVLYGTRQT